MLSGRICRPCYFSLQVSTNAVYLSKHTDDLTLKGSSSNGKLENVILTVRSTHVNERAAIMKRPLALFLDVTPCSLADRYQRYGGTCCLRSHGSYTFLTIYKIGSTFLLNVGPSLPKYKESRPKIQQYSR
jgi:hypothetical protein